jgi:hypothetical protein
METVGLLATPWTFGDVFEHLPIHPRAVFVCGACGLQRQYGVRGAQVWVAEGLRNTGMCEIWRCFFISQCEFVVVGDVVAGGYVVGSYAV